MHFDQGFWLRLHGGATHFPIVLLFVSVLLDGLALCWPDNRARPGLHSAASLLAYVAVIASFGAVISGLVISRWRTMGAGSLLRHHLFVWPAFALSISLVVWRLLRGDRASVPGFAIYIGGMAVASALMFAAGYLGGEMALAGELNQ
ncbi:MAG TPA: DUF2231 domain-containing protein [Chthoniobacterales bacterium]|nr:DUF2231 domain-containing protein [Chthoniobacterales bacterium]